MEELEYEYGLQGEEKESRGTNFMKVWDFMRLDFKLKNTELMVYAIIFAMHRNYCECFSGSREYLIKWSGGSKSGVERALVSLEERKLILKEYRQYGPMRKAIYFVNADMLPTCEMFALENRHRDNQEKIRRAKARSQKEKH